MRNIKWLLSSFGAVLIMGIAAASGQSFLTNGLVAYYPFNGNAIDESGNGNDAIVNGALIATDRFGLTNSAYSFDGISNYITIDHSAIFASQDFTVSMWFNAVRFPDTTSHNANEAETLIAKGRNNFALALGCPPFVNSGIRFLPRQENNHSWVADARSAAFDTNSWYHVVATWQEASHTSHVFLNGTELALTDDSGPDVPDNTSPARLGMDYNGPGGTNINAVPGNGGTPFQGILDDVRIYNRALASNEVHLLYASESHPPPPLNIYTAIEINFSAIPGQTYQIQSSSNLGNWVNVGSPIIGSNQMFQQFFSTRGTNAQFYQVLNVTP